MKVEQLRSTLSNLSGELDVVIVIHIGGDQPEMYEITDVTYDDNPVMLNALVDNEGPKLKAV